MATGTNSSLMFDLFTDVRAALPDHAVAMDDWLEVRAPGDVTGSQDFVRVVEDDLTLIVTHLNGRGLIKGEAKLSGSLVNVAAAIIVEVFNS